MFVSQARYDAEVNLRKEWEASSKTRLRLLDQANAENTRLLSLLELALKLKTPKDSPKPEVIPSSEPITEQPPTVVMAAIKATFPGDSQIYAQNYTYALTQKARWETEPEVLADEILKGR